MFLQKSAKVTRNSLGCRLSNQKPDLAASEIYPPMARQPAGTREKPKKITALYIVVLRQQNHILWYFCFTKDFSFVRLSKIFAHLFEAYL